MQKKKRQKRVVATAAVEESLGAAPAALAVTTRRGRNVKLQINTSSKNHSQAYNYDRSTKSRDNSYFMWLYSFILHEVVMWAGGSNLDPAQKAHGHGSYTHVINKQNF